MGDAGDFSEPIGVGAATDVVSVREMIGRSSTQASIAVRTLFPRVTVDWTQADYTWWDKFRRGKQKGFELGGLFAAPMASILADWTLGKGFDAVTDNDDTDTALAEFVDDVLDILIDWHFDSNTLGDSYLAVNPDGSLTRLPPNTVEVVTNPLDYREVWGYKITTRPDEARTITDEYHIQPRAYRKLTVKEGTRTILEEEYPLLIDELPIIPLRQGVDATEVFGHPRYEGLRTLFAEYDDVLRKSLDGVKLMGNPVPVVENADDPQQELDNNKTDTVTTRLSNGETADVPVIDFSLIKMFFFGPGTRFKFAQPGPFTQDAERTLVILFLLMLQHSRIPEWVWGGAISSSKASVEAQAPAFETLIKGQQRKVGKAIRILLRVWLKYRALVDPAIKVLPITLTWPDVLPPNEELRLKWATALRMDNAITKKTFVRASGLVDDAAAEVVAAEQEALDRQAAQDAAIQQEIDRLAEQPDNDDEETV